MKGSWKQARKKSASKRKRNARSREVVGLEAKVDDTGGRNGFGLEVSSHQEDEERQNTRKPGLYGGRSIAGESGPRRIRLFQTPNARNSGASIDGGDSKFSYSSKPTTLNPYKNNRSSTTVSTLSTHPKRSRRPSRRPTAAVHIVCAVSENLARETCVASLDAGTPVSLHITKQGNGQTYAETLAYLEVLQPDEVLLNEGRRNSHLTEKIMELYNVSSGADNILGFSTSNPGKKAKADRRAKARRQRVFTRSANNGDASDLDELNADGSEKDPQGPCDTCAVVKFVPRSYFDQTKGAEMLRRIARKDTYDSTLVDEYILLSSSHAVLQYTSLCLGATFSPSCLELKVNTGGGNRMMIDRSSLLHLELLANSKTGKIANSLIGTVDCTKTTVGSRLLRTNLMAPPVRIDTINARLDLVDTFLEDEGFFFDVMGHLQEFPDIDKMLTNIALVPWKRSKKNNSEETEVTSRVASKGISALVYMKSILSAIPVFLEVLEGKLQSMEEREHAQGSQSGAAERVQPSDETESNHDELDQEEGNNVFDGTSTVTGGTSLLLGLGGGPVTDTSETNVLRHHLLRAIIATMKQPALSEVLDAVADIFMETATFARNAHAMRYQECFALKPNTDGVMDVVRKAFLENVDDIYRLADEVAAKHEISVTVKANASRGYFLSVPADIASDLPEDFILPVKSGKFVYCTTEEVKKLNTRAQESIQDLLMLTHEKIQEVLAVARSHYDLLASLSDAIALLDMCHCFADNVASSRLPWCRPTVSDGPTMLDSNGTLSGTSSSAPRFGSGGDIAIRNGRYGIDLKATGLKVTDETSSMMSGDFVPNDTCASENRNFTVVTGINGSGKTQYLKQIAIIVVLGHCGSYVPAEEAFIPVRDRLCTRIGTADDQEHNISTFMLEMKETAFICNNASAKSLILIDELGRATSNEDGVAVTWAVSEYLLAKRSMTFFVTHYPQLSMLSNVYQAAQNQHMSAEISGDERNEISYAYKILPGACEASGDYGVEMSAMCGWPADAVAEARTLRKEIEQKLPDGSLCNVEAGGDSDVHHARRRAEETLQTLSSHLAAFHKCGSGLSNDAKRSYLQDLRTRLVPNSDLELIDCIKSILSDEPPPPITLPGESIVGSPLKRKALPPQDSKEPEVSEVASSSSSVGKNDARLATSISTKPSRARNHGGTKQRHVPICEAFLSSGSKDVQSTSVGGTQCDEVISIMSSSSSEDSTSGHEGSHSSTSHGSEGSSSSSDDDKSTTSNDSDGSGESSSVSSKHSSNSMHDLD